MIRIAIGYVSVVALCAALIVINPMDFMGQEAREARLQSSRPTVVAVETGLPEAENAASTAAILAQISGADTVEEAPEEALSKMSETVISNLRGEGMAEGNAAPTLEFLVAEALQKGQTDRVIDEIVNQAVAEGRVEAPAMLRTTDGKVDTAVLLAAILTQAQNDEFGQGDLSEPTAPVEGGTLALRAATEDVLYVVQPGDSLGALALRFYGDADLNGAIFKANRQVMDRPDSLRAGMKLLIPAKSSL